MTKKKKERKRYKWVGTCGMADEKEKRHGEIASATSRVVIIKPHVPEPSVGSLCIRLPGPPVDVRL
jgi:hypothetical protein